VPDDSVPLFMHVDGEPMRIAVCDEAGDWVRFALDRADGPWMFIADVYEGADGGGPFLELGVDLPVARIGVPPTGTPSAPPVVEAPQVYPVIALMDLSKVAAQFGPFAWVMLQDHLARLVERCSAPGASLVIRISVRERDATIALALHYDALCVDMAKTLFEVFEDFAAKPMLVAMPPPEPGTTPLFATVDGELYALGSGEDGQATPVVHIEGNHAALAFEQIPSGEQIQMALRRVRVRGSGTGRRATVEVDRQLPMLVAQIAEA
jgi:hypothetical protein